MRSRVYFSRRLALYRNVTACARVQVWSGLKVVADVPEVMPFAAAHATASAYHASCGTSVNADVPFPAAAPEALYRNVTMCARVQIMSGLKVSALVPTVMPFLTAHRMAS